MKRKNDRKKIPVKRKPIRLFLFTLVALSMMSIHSNAQTRFTRTTFNVAYTPITIGGGATSSTATGDNANQTGIPIGFSFGYADSTFTTVGLSTNGLIWFDAIAPATTAIHNALIATTAPNQCLSAWCNNLIDDASSDILYQTQGAPGSRTFTIQYTNYPTFTGVPGSNVRMNCQVILSETSNVIEFRYGTLNIIGGQTTSGGAMIGMEWGTGGNGKFIDAVTGSSIVSHKMLSPLSGWPSYNFRFTPGIPAPVSSGTYNVGVGQTYNSITEAVADVNHRGISGAVTLNLTDAQYDTTAANGSNIFPIFIATPNGSATNLLTISKSGAPATLAYRGSSIAASGAGFGTGVGTTVLAHNEEPLLGVCASYTTISNVNLITHGAPQTVEIGLAVFELFSDKGAQNNLFDKITVDLNRTNGSYGIYSFSTTSPGGLPGTNSNNIYRDITIRDCNSGITLVGVTSATGPSDYGNQIITSSCTTYNSIGDPNVPGDIGGGTSQANGIELHGQTGFILRNCIVSNVSCTSSTSQLDGIFISSIHGTCELSNNIVRNVKRINATSANPAIGIRLTSSGNEVKELRAFNNSVSEILTTYTGVPTASRKAIGISVVGTGNIGKQKMYIYNNSVSIDGSTFLNASNACFEITNAANVEHIVKNNVFANFTPAQTGVAGHYSFVTSAVDRIGYSVLSSSDYNDLYVANDQGTSGHVGLGATTNYSTLAAWQSGITAQAGTDANSVSANPFFVNNNNDLHGSSSSTALDGTGTSLPAYITTDFDCQTRTAPQDIGFDDFSVCNADGGAISPAVVSVCASATYSMTSTGFSSGPGTSYQWMISSTPGGPYTNVTGGSGASSTTYTTGTLNAGTYYYIMKTTCNGLGVDFSNELKLTVKALPSATITPAGPTTFCTGGNVTLNAPADPNRSYQWKKSGTDISGATSSSYTATNAGNYKVVVTNTSSGCTKITSNATVVTKNALPAATVTAQGPTTFCSGGSVLLLANTGTGLTYQWKKSGNIVSGATAATYTATSSGNYKVVVTNANGCSKTAATGVVVTSNPLPAATITPQGPTTFCAGGNVILQANTGAGLTYKWKKNGNYINGQTLSGYTATTAGNYKVEVTNSNGCSKTSGSIAVTVPCKEGEGLIATGFDISVYPNPADAEINISYSLNDSFEVEIVNMLGEKVIRAKNQSRIDISMLTSGVYFVKVLTPDQLFTQKLIKQ